MQGESFNVRPLDHDSQTVASRMVGAFDQIFVRTQREREEPDVPTAGFKPVPVLADGFCFWHCFLRASLPEDYSPYERTTSGGPRSKPRLAREIELAKVAREEFLLLYAKQPNFDEVLLESLQENPQVPIDYVQTICLTSGVSVRITLSQEASLWEPNMFHSLLNHLLRIYD